MGEVRRYTDGTRVLAQTNEQLRAAMAGLRRVSTVATVNGIGNMEHHRHGMFGGRREEFGRGGIGGIGHEMENVVEMRSFKEAKAHTEAAIQMVEQARQIMPNMPYIDMTQGAAAVWGSPHRAACCPALPAWLAAWSGVQCLGVVRHMHMAAAASLLIRDGWAPLLGSSLCSRPALVVRGAQVTRAPGWVLQRTPMRRAGTPQPIAARLTV
jgi:hypothetical protein